MKSLATIISVISPGLGMFFYQRCLLGSFYLFSQVFGIAGVQFGMRTGNGFVLLGSLAILGFIWVSGFGIVLHLTKAHSPDRKEEGEDVYKKARLLALQGNLGEARKAFESIYKKDSEDKDVLFQLGSIEKDLENHKEAKKLLERYKKRNPTGKWILDVEEMLFEIGKKSKNKNG